MQHDCWDWAGIGALRRWAFQFHSLLREQWCPEGAAEVELLWLLEWVVHTACALHDAQNAFEWGIPEKFDNSELLKAVYIGSCSVRNSTNIIITYLAEWVTVSIQQVAPLDEATTNQFRLLWSTLGLDTEVIHMLVDVLQLRMEGDKVLVTRGCPSHDLTSIVVSVLMAVWRARKFTDSRWLLMGRSARALVASRLTGLPSLLEYSSRKPSVSTYYLGGFLRLTEEHWLFLVECALVARVPEVAQEALLRDNRVALTAPKIKAEMEVATKTLAELPASLWAVLATIGGHHRPTIARRLPQVCLPSSRVYAVPSLRFCRGSPLDALQR